MKKYMTDNHGQKIDHDIVLYSGKLHDTIIVINQNKKWYNRLWYLISNPFTYLFIGKIRY